MTAFHWQIPQNGNWSSAGDWTPSGVPSTSADTADISVNGSPYTVTLNVNETIGALSIGGNGVATLEIGSNQLTVTNAGGQAGTVTVSAGTISISGGTLSATGGFSAAAGSAISGSGTLIGTIAGAGLYQATVGTLRLESAVLASATRLEIANNGPAVLRLDGTVASGAAIAFLAAVGTLDLTDISGNLLQGFSGTIKDLAVGSSATVPTNQIDLAGLATANITGTGLNTSTDVLTVTTTGGMFTLQLSGSYASGTNVDWITDGAGTGSDLFLSTVPCFCRGTLIQTARGEVPVEELAVGDRVETLSGSVKPIVWIGMGRSLVTGANKLARPIIVRRGALADGVPHRDLYLTHGHALYFDGVLIPVENLVNHRSIVWDERARVVEYYHLELEDHDVVLANGTPAETYYDASNRASFQITRPGSAPGQAKPAFAPVLNGGEIVEGTWTTLFERASGQVERETTDDPDLHLMCDGARLDPISASEGVYTFALERAPAVPLLLCSRSGVPSLLGLDRHDHRPLGLAIRQIILHQPGIMTCFDHDAPLFAEGGCHLPENGYCWTDGEFALPARLFGHLRETFTLIVHTRRQTMRYPVRAAITQVA
jgi:hypothetical protein